MMTKNKIISFIATLLILFPSIGYAQQITVLNKGDIAPFEGVLLSKDALAKIQATIDQIPKQVKLAEKVATQKCETECTFKISEIKTSLTKENNKLKIEIEAKDKENQVLQNRLKKAEKDQSNTVLWTSGGFIGGVLATIAIVFAVK